MIPDEAVQAARVKLEDVLGGWFDDLDAIRQILEAAYPHIASAVLNEAAESAIEQAFSEVTPRMLQNRARSYKPRNAV